MSHYEDRLNRILNRTMMCTDIDTQLRVKQRQIVILERLLSLSKRVGIDDSAQREIDALNEELEDLKLISLIGGY